MTGQVIGNYRVIDRLGGGGMGKVYRAIDMMVEREVAMKALHPEIAHQPETLERFRTEAVTLARLNHPSIAQLYTFFREGSDFYMVMEYVPGETLEARLGRGPIPWREAFDVAAAVLEAIHFAHQQQILHRDLKPANIMITSQGQVKVMDFGIAQALGRAKLTREGRVVGTVEYLAPERIRGAAPDARSDLYSMGIVLYEMITGRLPFKGDTEYSLMMAQLNEAPERPAVLVEGLPAEAEQVLMKALEKDPDRRYPDAETFAAAVRRARNAGSKETRIAQAPDAEMNAAAKPRATRNQWGPIAAAAVVLLVIGAFLYMRSRTGNEDAWSQARTPAPSSMPAASSAPAPPPLAVDPTPIPVGLPATVEPSPSAPKPPASAPAPPAARQFLGDSGPISLPALLAALRAGAPPREIVEAVRIRGIDFQPTPNSISALREAGAGAELLRAIEATRRTPEPAIIASTPAAESEPAPPPVPARRTVATLSDVRRIYLESMPGDLDDHLRNEIGQRLAPRLKVASSAAQADAVLKVRIEEMKGGSFSRAGRVFGLSDKTRVYASVIEPSSRKVLWEDRAGDRTIVTGLFKGDGMKRLASRIVRSLEEEIEEGR